MAPPVTIHTNNLTTRAKTPITRLDVSHVSGATIDVTMFNGDDKIGDKRITAGCYQSGSKGQEDKAIVEEIREKLLYPSSTLSEGMKQWMAHASVASSNPGQIPGCSI